MSTATKTRPPRPRGHDRGETLRAGVGAVVTTGRVTGAVTAGAVRWTRARPPERYPLPAAAGVYGAAAGAHAAQVPATALGPVAAGAAAAAYGITAARTRDEAKAGKVAAAVAAAGTWTSVAAEVGVLAGPGGMVTWSYAALFGLGYGIYRADRGIKDRIAWREAKTQWHRLAAQVGLDGSHLLSREDTRLGDALVIDTRGTGKRASQIASSDLAERFAELEGLPASRVQVNSCRVAGRVRISIRRADPWANPSPHPLLDTDPEVDLPAAADVTKPVAVGADPETGRPLVMETFNEDGAVNTVVVAIKGGGKTILINNLLERLTSSPAAMVCVIDVSKAKDYRRWRAAGALGPSALGADERARAVKILACLDEAIKHRAKHNPDAVWQPAPGAPKIDLIIDEIDALVGAGDGLAAAAVKHLTSIASKGRSEAIGVTICGQRGTAQWLGGADLRVLIDQFVIGKVNRSGEASHAAGEMGLSMPDMAGYGEGHGGVMAIAALGGDVDLGRTFLLKEFADIDKVAAGRSPSPIEPALAEHLGDKWASLVDDPSGTSTPTAGDGSPAGQSLTVLDEELEESMPAELSDTLARMRADADARADIRDYLANLRVPEPPTDPDQAAAVETEMARRRAEADNQVHIPDEARATLLEALRVSPKRRDELADELGVTVKTIQRYTARLLRDGVIDRGDGKGKASRYHLRGD